MNYPTSSLSANPTVVLKTAPMAGQHNAVAVTTASKELEGLLAYASQLPCGGGAVHRLPDEILLAIFRLLRGQFHGPAFEGPACNVESWISVTWVCQAWRTVAVSSKTLWTELPVLHEHWCETFARHCHLLPVAVHALEEHMFSDHAVTTNQARQPVASAVKSVAMVRSLCACLSLFEDPWIFIGPAPHLEDVFLCDDQHDPTDLKERVLHPVLDQVGVFSDDNISHILETFRVLSFPPECIVRITGLICGWPNPNNKTAIALTQAVFGGTETTSSWEVMLDEDLSLIRSPAHVRPALLPLVNSPPSPLSWPQDTLPYTRELCFWRGFDVETTMQSLLEDVLRHAPPCLLKCPQVVVMVEEADYDEDPESNPWLACWRDTFQEATHIIVGHSAATTLAAVSRTLMEDEGFPNI
ncbi:hypothetical protein OF83DRAFT_1089031 [Amylostereum chailletii]|nr:hypothetical protein OF83DRAFT_1089031 [Amylostereum chailletii]